MSSYSAKQSAWRTFVDAWSHIGRSKGDYLRLAAMDLIMLFRTIQAVAYIVRSAANDRTTSVIIGCIFGVLGTGFVASSLAWLAVAQGKRRALGINWSRLHFDILLLFFLLVSLGLMIGFFAASGLTNSGVLFAVWCVVWTLISLSAVIAVRPSTTSDSYA